MSNLIFFNQGSLLRLRSSHARDNKIHYYELPTAAPSISRSAASAVPSAKDPSTLSPTWSLDVNALAYCKMSVLPIPDAPAGTALVAVTALTKDELVRIIVLTCPTQIDEGYVDRHIPSTDTGSRASFNRCESRPNRRENRSVLIDDISNRAVLT